MNLLKRFADQWTPRKVAYRYRQVRNALVDSHTLWEKGLHEEIEFWEDVFHNPNNPHYRHPVALARPDRPLQAEIRDKLEVPPDEVVRILDIGAGPVTQLGYVWDEHEIVIVPIDPLADEYNRLLDSVGCTPPFRTQRCHAEDIAKQFEPQSFHFIFSRNALDHAYDPMGALRQAETLLKPGGSIFLRHVRNEGKRIYGGLHQWNFDIQAGVFVLWNMQQRYVIAEELKSVVVQAQLSTVGSNEVVDAQLKKLASMTDNT